MLGKTPGDPKSEKLERQGDDRLPEHCDEQVAGQSGDEEYRDPPREADWVDETGEQPAPAELARAVDRYQHRVQPQTRQERDRLL